MLNNCEPREMNPLKESCFHCIVVQIVLKRIVIDFVLIRTRSHFVEKNLKNAISITMNQFFVSPS